MRSSFNFKNKENKKKENISKFQKNRPKSHNNFINNKIRLYNFGKKDKSKNDFKNNFGFDNNLNNKKKLRIQSANKKKINNNILNQKFDILKFDSKNPKNNLGLKINKNKKKQIFSNNLFMNKGKNNLKNKNYNINNNLKNINLNNKKKNIPVKLFQNNNININNISNLNQLNSNNLIKKKLILGKNLGLTKSNPIEKRKRPNSISKFSDYNNEIFEPHAKGLVNVGATCYMNATLQCMAHIQRLTYSLLKPKNIEKISSNKSKYKLSYEYIEVLKNLWKKKNIKYYSPDNFKNVISEMNPLFAGIQANDSKDLVLFLMETLHNELNTPVKKDISNQSNQIVNQNDYETTFKLFSNFFTNNYRSIISDIFYGMYNSIMTCLNCNYVTHNVQCFNILIFPLEEVRKFKGKIENKVKIIECFEYYQKVDNMFGENKIYCNHCKSHSNSCNTSKLIISPNILVINLNRGKGLEFNIKIDLDEYLDIKKFVYYEKSPSYYELIGIVTHFGSSDMSGHFIAFCKSFIDQNWYKYNDSEVSISSFDEAKSTGVHYILFYSYIQR